MILALALGMIIGGGVVGVSAMTGLIPAFRVNTPPANNATVNTPPPLSSITYVVLQIKGDSLSAVDPDNHAVVVHTTATTTYQREGLSASYKDIGVGTRMTIRGKIANDNSIYADRIAILDPALTGTISGLKGNTLSVDSRGQTTLAKISAGTTILDTKTRHTLKQSDLLAGRSVQVYGAMDITGTFDAFLILVEE
jgi:hypothetical protein